MTFINFFLLSGAVAEAAGGLIVQTGHRTTLEGCHSHPAQGRCARGPGVASVLVSTRLCDL